jgi:hypothetical protein
LSPILSESIPSNYTAIAGGSQRIFRGKPA